MYMGPASTHLVHISSYLVCTRKNLIRTSTHLSVDLLTKESWPKQFLRFCVGPEPRFWKKNTRWNSRLPDYFMFYCKDFFIFYLAIINSVTVRNQRTGPLWGTKPGSNSCKDQERPSEPRDSEHLKQLKKRLKLPRFPDFISPAGRPTDTCCCCCYGDKSSATSSSPEDSSKPESGRIKPPVWPTQGCWKFKQRKLRLKSHSQCFYVNVKDI